MGSIRFKGTREQLRIPTGQLALVSSNRSSTKREIESKGNFEIKSIINVSPTKSKKAFLFKLKKKSFSKF